MFGFHGPELIIVLVVALLIFGPKRLPEMGSSIGKSIKEFRKGMNELSHPKEDNMEKAPDLNAIEREAASKYDANAFQHSLVNDDVANQKTNVEVTRTETRVE